MNQLVRRGRTKTKKRTKTLALHANLSDRMTKTVKATADYPTDPGSLNKHMSMEILEKTPDGRNKVAITIFFFQGHEQMFIHMLNFILNKTFQDAGIPTNYLNAVDRITFL